MKKWIITVFIIAVVVLVAVYFKPNHKTAEDTKPIVKIGVVAPLSGNNAVIGKQMKDGIEFARQKIDTPLSYEVIFEDDQLNPARTINAVNKLINNDKVDVLLSATSMEAQIAAPITAKNNVLHLAVSSDTTFTQHNDNYALAPSVDAEVNVLLKEIARRGYKKVALIASEEVYSNLAADKIKKYINEYGLNLVYDSRFVAPQRDFKMIMSEANAKQPDIFIFQTWMPEADILAKHVKDSGKNTPFTSLYAFFLSHHSELYEGQFAVNIGVIDKGFSEEFYQKYGKYPEQMSGLSYLMLELVLNTLNNPKQPRENIFARSNSVVGQLTMEDKAIRFTPVIQEFKNGNPVLIE